METVKTRRSRPIERLAWYNNTLGRATLVVGHGYVFRREGEHCGRLVSYRDTGLLVLNEVKGA